MDPAGAIGKLGFRRWYERELVVCHAWLVACLLCAFALLGLLEGLNVREAGWGAVPVVAAAFAAGCIAWYALARYLGMLLRAMHLAERSSCPGCGAHGRYRLVSASAHAMTVRCRKCEKEWTIE